MPASGQTQTKAAKDSDSSLPLSYSVEVELVQIHVRVSDKNGKWISGLKKEDFEIYEDGKLQKIRYVDELTVESPPQVTPEPASAGDSQTTVQRIDTVAMTRNSVILIFDAASSGKTGIRKQREYAKEFLNKFQTPNTIFGVFLIKPTGEYEMLQNLTSDKAGLLQAIDQTYGVMSGVEDKQARTSQISNLIDSCAGDPGCVGGIIASLIRLAKMHAKEEQTRAGNALRSLKELLPLLGHAPGKKTIILISEGPDPVGGFYYNYVANVIHNLWERYGFPPEALGPIIKDLQIEASIALANMRGIADVIRSANAYDLSIYWINPEYGKVAGSISLDQDLPPASEHLVPVPDIQMSMRGVAEDTGGEALYSTDFREFYDRIAEEIPRYYLISYKPERSRNDGKTHRVKVKVREKDAIVAYAKNFMDLKSSERIDRVLAEAQDFPETTKQLPLVSEVKYFKKSSGVYYLMLRAGIPWEVVAPRITEDKAVDDIHFSFIVRSEKGEILLNAHPILQLRSPYSEFETLSENKTMLEYFQGCSLKPGNYQFSVAVLDSASGSTATSSGSFRLPEENQSCLSLSPPMLAGTVTKSTTISKFPTTTEKGEILYGENVLNFSTKRVLSPTGSLSGFYQIYNARKNAGGAPLVFVSFRLYKDQSLISETGEREITSYTNPSHRLISNFFSVPYKNLTPGLYELEISTHEGATLCKDSARVVFEVSF